MNKDIKIILIFLSIVSIILLYSSIVLFVVNQSEKDKRIALQKNFDEVMVIKQDLENRLKEIEIAHAELKANIKSQEERMGLLSQQLDGERTTNTKNITKLQEKEFELQSLKVRMEEEKSEKEDLLKRLDKLNENYLNAKFQLESLLKTKEEMDKRAKELAEKEGVSLGTIVINQPAKR